MPGKSADHQMPEPGQEPKSQKSASPGREPGKGHFTPHRLEEQRYHAELPQTPEPDSRHATEACFLAAAVCLVPLAIAGFLTTRLLFPTSHLTAPLQMLFEIGRAHV